MPNEYQGSGGAVVTGLEGAVAVLRANPARYQAFKFCLGDWCGVPGSPILHKVVRVKFDAGRIYYTVKSHMGSQNEYPEALCLTESELRYSLVRAEEFAYADATVKINRLLNLGG